MAAYADPHPDPVVARALGYPYSVTAKSFTLVDGAAAPFAAEHRAGRTPVIGYGSNQSPERLRQKYGTTHAPIAVQRGWLADHDVVYSAHLAVYGSLPAALRHVPGTTVAVAVNWLDDGQLALMHESEAYNYHYARLSDIALALDDGTSLDSAYGYLSFRGHFAVDGAPLALAEVAAGERSLAEAPQPEALELARRRLAPEQALDSFVHSTVNDTALRRDRIARLMAAALPVAHAPHDVLPIPAAEE